MRLTRTPKRFRKSASLNLKGIFDTCNLFGPLAPGDPASSFAMAAASVGLLGCGIASPSTISVCCGYKHHRILNTY